MIPQNTDMVVVRFSFSHFHPHIQVATLTTTHPMMNDAQLIMGMTVYISLGPPCYRFFQGYANIILISIFYK
jgi:hypothetical protein